MLHKGAVAQRYFCATYMQVAYAHGEVKHGPILEFFEQLERT
jgi:hypothetical protein